MSEHEDMDQDLLERYRRASTTDGARPNEATRNAILENARRQAAENAKTSSFDTQRPAANWPRWRIAAGTLGVAVLGVLLMFPRYSTQPERVTSSSPDMVTSPSQDEVTSLSKDKLPSTNSPASPPVSMPSEAPPPPPTQKPAPSPKAEELRKERDQAPQVMGGSSAYRAKRQESSDKALQEVAVTGQLQGESYARSAAAPAAASPAPAESADTATRTVSNQALARTDSLHILDGQSPAAQLAEAVHAGNAARVDALLAEGADTSHTDPAGRTPLMLAVMANRKDLVSELLAHGADPNQADFSGTTPLQKARSLKNDEIAVLLTNAGAR